MAGYLQSSGAIALSQINSVFDGRGLNLNAYRGTTWFTSAGGSGTFSSSAIAFGDFYSKGPSSAAFSFTISGNQTNADLRTLAINAGWNQSSKVIATINGGVYISSNSTGTPGLTVNGSFPGGVDLINNGFIIGMGGGGGNGGGGFGENGFAGAGGGLALSVSVAVTVTNNGTIGGGGGGGGGASTFVFFNGFTTVRAGGGGGGGGRTGATNSSGGAGGVSPNGTGTAGGAGTSGGGGVGGAGAGNVNNKGGDGGNWGSAGSAAPGVAGAPNPGAGGAAGAAISGNSNITYVATGTRLGAIT
jgi:hypothetical protein